MERVTASGLARAGAGAVSVTQSTTASATAARCDDPNMSSFRLPHLTVGRARAVRWRKRRSYGESHGGVSTAGNQRRGTADLAADSAARIGTPLLRFAPGIHCLRAYRSFPP